MGDAFGLLEPDAGKLARPVLRGGGGREAASLPACIRGFDPLHPLQSTSKNPDLRASAARLACLPLFIPTAALRLKFSSGQPEGYPSLKLRFLAYISHICGAAKFFLRLAFGRTLNF